MTMRNQDNPFRRFFASRLFLIILFIVIALIAMSYTRAYYQHYKIQKEIASLKQEIGLLEKKKLESISILEYVQSDTFVEEKARTELHKKKPGEQVLFIESEEIDISEKETSLSAENSRQDMPNPVKWWYYFTHSTPQEE